MDDVVVTDVSLFEENASILLFSFDFVDDVDSADSIGFDPETIFVFIAVVDDVFVTDAKLEGGKEGGIFPIIEMEELLVFSAEGLGALYPGIPGFALVFNDEFRGGIPPIGGGGLTLPIPGAPVADGAPG